MQVAMTTSRKQPENKTFAANICTPGTFAYTSTTDREVRLLHSSEAYLKWSHGKKVAILSGHQRAMRNNTQLLFVCLLAAMLVLLGGPFGPIISPLLTKRGESVIQNVLNFETLNSIFKSNKGATTTFVVGVSALGPVLRDRCVVVGSVDAQPPKAASPPLNKANSSPTPQRVVSSSSNTTTTLSSYPSSLREMVLGTACIVVADTLSSTTSLSVTVTPIMVAFAGIVIYVLGFVQVLLPRLIRFRNKQDRAKDISAVAAVNDATSPCSLFEETPTILNPTVPLLLPTAKSSTPSCFNSSSSRPVGFTNEGELIDSYERALMGGNTAAAAEHNIGGGWKLVGALECMWIGLVILEIALCMQRSSSSSTLKRGGSSSFFFTYTVVMCSISEWALLLLTIKAHVVAAASSSKQH